MNKITVDGELLCHKRDCEKPLIKTSYALTVRTIAWTCTFGYENFFITKTISCQTELRG
eukprot:UN22436